MSGAGSEPLYRDVQRRKPWFAWPVILPLAAFGWWMFIQQIVLRIPFGTSPPPDSVVWLMWGILGIFGPGIVWLLRLTIDVRTDEVVVRYRPLLVKRFAISEIESAEAVMFRPMRDWLGWGIRWMPGKGWAYTISGDRGVALRFRDGGRVLIGARDAEGVAEVITNAPGA